MTDAAFRLSLLHAQLGAVGGRPASGLSYTPAGLTFERHNVWP